MVPLGLLVLVAAAPPVPGPVLTAGDELVYAGEVREESTRFGAEYRRRFELTVRVLALGGPPGRTDLAVLTRLRPLEDPHVRDSADAVSGSTDGKPAAAAARLDLIRLDSRGRAAALKPAARVPLPLMNAPAVAPPGVPLDAPAAVELGMFVPAPAEAAPSWPGGGLTWTAGPLGVRDGAQVIELVGVAESADWTNRTGTSRAWRRADRVWASPADGLARQFERTVERTVGLHVVERRQTQVTLTQSNLLRGEAFEAARREVGFAYVFGAEAEAGKSGALKARIDRFRREHEPTAYREAVDAVARRLEP